jgi:hypothetical protein
LDGNAEKSTARTPPVAPETTGLVGPGHLWLAIRIRRFRRAALEAEAEHDMERKMNDQTLYCVQCDEPFTFSASDQEKFRQRGFDSPRRCPACRQHRVRMADAFHDHEGRRRNRPRRRPHHDDEHAYL